MRHLLHTFRKSNQNGRSILWGWSVSYLIVLFIPLITVFLNYRVNISALRTQVVSLHESYLDKTVDNIDSCLEAEKSFYSYVFNNEDYTQLLNYSSYDTNFYYHAKTLRDSLYNYRESSAIDIHCLLLLKNMGYVITDGTANIISTYYNSLQFAYSNLMDYAEWEETLWGSYGTQYFVGAGLTGSSSRSLFYVSTPRNSLYKNASIFISIPLTELAAQTGSVPGDACLILLIDGEPAAAFSGGFVTEIPEEAWSPEATDEESDASGEGWVTMTRDSAQNGISYRLMVSQDTMWAEIENLRRTFQLNVLITLCFGLCGCVIMLFRNYRPVRELQLETHGGAEPEGGGNELLGISRAYRDLMTEHQKSRSLLSRQREELLMSWLLTLMKGRALKEEVEERIAFFDLNLEGQLALVGFSIPPSDLRDEQSDDLLFFTVDNIFSELMNSLHFYRVEDGRFLFYLFDLQELSEEEWKRQVLDGAEYLCDFIEEKCHVVLTCVVSDTEETLEDVRFLYQRVMETFEYQSVMGGSGVIETQYLEEQSRSGRLMDFVRDGLKDALKEGDASAARAVIQRFFAASDKISFGTVKMCMYDSFNLVMDIFRDYETDPVRLAELFPFVEQLTRAADTQELETIFTRMLDLVCEKIRQRQSQETGSVVRRVKQYIIEHYAEQSLNISAIASQLQRNPKYISRVFKEETGEGILDYINRHRILSAQKLMADKKYTMEEIAEMVGYSNTRTFRRAFVKVTGDVPSRFLR